MKAAGCSPVKFRYADVCCITIKPVFMNNFRLFLACLSIFAVFVSCEDERYDLSQGVDLTVSIGGDSLALPIGTTSSISLKSLMDSYGGNAGSDDYIKVLEDGTYAFMMSGQESFEFDQISSGGLSMDDYSVSSSIDIAITEGLQSGYASEIPPLYIDFDEVLDFSMSIDDVPGQIESLDSIILSSAYIDVDLYLENLPDLGADGRISVKAGMTIPESLILDGMSGNYYYVDEPLSEDGRLNVRIPVRGLRIGDIENGAITFNETVGLAGSFILEDVSIDHGELIGREVTLGYSALFGNIMPTDVYGKFNYSIDDYNVSVDIGNSLPDFMKGDDVVLDFSNPFLLLSLNTNISIPFEASMNLTPFVGESPNVDGIQEISMKMKASQSADSYVENNYMVGVSDKSLSEYPGYEFVQAELNGLLNPVPDSLRLSLSAAVSEMDQYHIVLDCSYSADIDYELVVPFELGPDFKAGFSETVDIEAGNVADIITDMLRSGKAAVLKGEMTNSIPLNLAFNIKAVDQYGQLLPVSSKDGVLPACNPDGSPVVAPWRLELSADAPIDENASIGGLIIDIRIASGEDISGIPVGEDDFVKLSVSFQLQGGFEGNIEDLMKTE